MEMDTPSPTRRANRTTGRSHVYVLHGLFDLVHQCEDEFSTLDAPASGTF